MRNSYFGALEFLVFSIYIRSNPVEVTGVVGVSPALWYFRYIASIFLTLQLLSQAPVIKLSLNKGIRTSRDLDISVLNICDISVLGTGNFGTE